MIDSGSEDEEDQEDQDRGGDEGIFVCEWDVNEAGDGVLDVELEGSFAHKAVTLSPLDPLSAEMLGRCVGKG